MPKSRVIDVKHQTKTNESFRKVLFTGEKSQLVVMSLKAGEDIGAEIHDVDQLLYVVKGSGKAVIDGVEEILDKGSVFCVTAGTKHNVRNTGGEPLKLFTVYAPPQHAPDTVHLTKADAAKAEREAAPA